MGSADDEGPKRPGPTRRVFRPANAWDTQSDSMRAQPAPQQKPEPNPPEPTVSQKDQPPSFESKVERLNRGEQQAERQQTAPTAAPSAQQEAKAPTPAIATPDPAAAQNAERAVERGETVITFTEYSRPNGRKEEVELECHSDTKRLADGLVLKGYRFECETLPDMTISLTAVDPNNEDDVAIELSERRSEIPNAVRSLVNKAVEFDRRQELVGDLVQTPQQKPEPKPPEPAAQQEAKAPTPADNHQLSGSDQGRQAGRKAGMPPPIPNYYSELERTHQHVADMQRGGIGQSASIGASKPEPIQRPEAQGKPKTMEEFLERERQDHAERFQPKAPQHPNAVPHSIEQPAHVREAEDKKTAQQEAAKRPTQQSESTGEPKTMEEFLARERRDHAERFGKAELRSAGREITQRARGQSRGPSFGGGISG